MKKSFYKALSLILALTLMFTVVGCGGNTSTGTGSNPDATASPLDTGSENAISATEAASGDGVIRFAVCSPLTGDMAEQGYQEVNGAQMAIDEINVAGGVNGKKFELVAMDDMGNPNQSTIVAEKIVADDSIEFVIAHMFSGCTMAAMPTYLKKNIAVFGPGNSRTDLTEQGWTNYLRICPADIHAIKAMVDYAVAQGYERPFVFYQNGANEVSAFGIMKDYLKTEYSIELVGSETFAPETDRDFSSHIAKIKESNADIVLMSCEYSPAALLAKQLETMGVDVDLLGLGGVSNPALIELAGEAAEGIMCTCAFDPTNPDSGVQAFVKEYSGKHGLNPNDVAAWSYEIMYAIAEAYENGATAETLSMWMRENTDYKGATGNIRFDENGDNIEAKTYILKVENGVFTLIK